tara:strand:+ start:328 stop:1284 length:957 start_codon:yes stop_codon:yes gene_type:complete
MNKFIYLLLLSISLCQFTIKDGKAYDLSYDKYYSDQEFIDFLSCDPNFYNDTHLKKFKKSHRNLKFKRNWYIYLMTISSIGAGVEGIRYPERWDEGGDNYDIENPDEKPPGFESIAVGVILYTSYFGYNKIRKNRSLPRIINKYNKLYLNEEIEEIEIPYRFVDNISDSDKRERIISMGFLSDKIPVSLIDISTVHNINKHSDFYGTLSTTILGAGLGVGYKYHILDKYMTTPFIGTSLFAYGGSNGDASTNEWETIGGFSVYSGVSLFRSNNNPFFNAPTKKVKKHSINFGAHWTYIFGDGSYDLYPLPFLNVEIRN